MVISLRLQHPEFPEPEVSETVNYALRKEAEQARLRRDYYAEQCHAFETKHEMSSDEFQAKFDAGTLGDAGEWFDWYAMKRGFNLWDRRFSILSGVSV